MAGLTRIRFRSDSAHGADDKSRIARGLKPLFTSDPAELAAIEAAQPGDCWRARWWKKDGDGPIAGYAICCPQCKNVHWWTEASNCMAGRKPGGRCIHHGTGSCWRWIGSAEAGTLSASPSLWAKGPSGCGWHGFLENGILKG